MYKYKFITLNYACSDDEDVEDEALPPILKRWNEKKDLNKKTKKKKKTNNNL